MTKQREGKYHTQGGRQSYLYIKGLGRQKGEPVKQMWCFLCNLSHAYHKPSLAEKQERRAVGRFSNTNAHRPHGGRRTRPVRMTGPSKNR